MFKILFLIVLHSLTILDSAIYSLSFNNTPNKIITSTTIIKFNTSINIISL